MCHCLHCLLHNFFFFFSETHKIWVGWTTLNRGKKAWMALTWIPHLLTVHCMQMPSFSVNIMQICKHCHNLSNVYLKTVNNQRLSNQSDHDIRFCYHETAASVECLNAPLAHAWSLFLPISFSLARQLTSLAQNFCFPPLQGACWQARFWTILIQRSIEPHSHFISIGMSKRIC